MRRIATALATLLVLSVPPVAAAPPEAADAPWIDTLPKRVQGSILWSADHEEGTMADWTLPDWQYAGGGIFNTGDADEVWAAASTTFAHSGNHSAVAHISNAWHAENGSRAVRLMRWTDKAWDDSGEYLPKSAYYSTWVYFDETYNPNKYDPWDPGDGGWWNIFQFKADVSDNGDDSIPMWTLNVDHNDATDEMALYLYSKENAPYSFPQSDPIPIPVGQWVHLEAQYVVSAQGTGVIRIWQDGLRILSEKNVMTAAHPDYEHATWGIGNYTDHIAGGPVDGTADLYFDDAAISTRRLSRYLDK